MKVWISASNSDVVTCLLVTNHSDGTETEITCLEGELPCGLTVQDLGKLGIVTYEPDSRGRPIPKVSPIEPSENLEYLRALIEAMPPGYFVSKVESEKIDALRKEKAEAFEKVLEGLADDDA